MISIGVALLAVAARVNNGYDDMRNAPIWLAGAMMIGAGIMAPYGRVLRGAKIGVIVALSLVALFCIVVFVGAIIGSLMGG
jgi:hypothetical protein